MLERKPFQISKIQTHWAVLASSAGRRVTPGISRVADSNSRATLARTSRDIDLWRKVIFWENPFHLTGFKFSPDVPHRFSWHASDFSDLARSHFPKIVYGIIVSRQSCWKGQWENCQYRICRVNQWSGCKQSNKSQYCVYFKAVHLDTYVPHLALPLSLDAHGTSVVVEEGRHLLVAWVRVLPINSWIPS